MTVFYYCSFHSTLLPPVATWKSELQYSLKVRRVSGLSVEQRHREKMELSRDQFLHTAQGPVSAGRNCQSCKSCRRWGSICFWMCLLTWSLGSDQSSHVQTISFVCSWYLTLENPFWWLINEAQVWENPRERILLEMLYVPDSREGIAPSALEQGYSSERGGGEPSFSSQLILVLLPLLSCSFNNSN